MRTPERHRPTPSFRYSPLIAALACTFGSSIAQAATFPVTSTANAGTGSLRDVIGQVNLQADCATTGGHVIEFATASTVPSGPFIVGSPQPIQLESTELQITCNNVELRGQDMVILEPHPFYGGFIYCGLNAQPAAGLTTISGMTVRNFSYGSGICGSVHATGNRVHGNWTGFSGGGSIIGGPALADRNFIYGNAGQGIAISDGLVENNFIGTPDGLQGYGINSSESLGGLTIRKNLISWSTYSGIDLSYINGGVVIEGNTIGLDASGDVAPNGAGISAYSVWGSLTIKGNVVSGNNSSGIDVYSIDSLLIQGNKVGTNASGTAALGNGFGIDVSYSYGQIDGNLVAGNANGGIYLGDTSLTVSNNQIGGASALSNNGPGVTISPFSNVAQFSATDLEPKVAKVLGAGNMLVDNVIAHNNGDGVFLVNGTSNNTITGSVSGQSIHSNSGKNINLDYLGPRPNDVRETSGPNNGQNRPTIVSVVEASGSTVIQGSLLSFAKDEVLINGVVFSGQFEIDLYGNDLSGPAGQRWLGKATAITNASGIATFTATIPGTGKGYVAATATGPFGTSEFSDTRLALFPAASILPTSVPFGSVPVGTTATTPVEIAFRSNGTGDYVINSISQGATAPSCPATSTPVCAAGEFSCSVSCTVGTPYPPLPSPTSAPSCKISGLSFHPTTGGAKSTKLWVCDNAGPAPRAITLTGTGVANVTVSLSPWDVAFGPVPVGSTSPTRTIAVSNNGENGVPLSELAVTGPYSLVGSTCGTSLPPMSFCEAQVAFAPVAAGLVEGSFSALIGVEGAPPYVARLSGTGTQQASLVLPEAIDFGAMLRGDPAAVHALELRNSGNALLTFSTRVGGPFALSGGCGTSLAPGAACTLLITFTPSAIGAFAGTLDVSSNAPGGSGTIPLTARVQAQPRPDIRVDVSEMGFGDRMIGTRSGSQRVTVSNLGTVAAQLGVVPPTRDFIATSQCGATLAPGASCTTDVSFMPMAFGQRINRLQFTSDAPGSPFGVGLVGRGCSPPRPGRPPSCN